MRAKQRYALNVIGPFYVEDGCCTSCGVPASIAPELFSQSDREHCYVRRQPENAAETEAMLRVIVTQDLGCIRYGGSDPAVLRCLVESGERAQCDVPTPRGVVPMRRDHVTFIARQRPISWTAREILERLVAFNSAFRTTAIYAAADGSASVSVSWYEDSYYRIDALASNESGRWVVRHHGPSRLSDSIHDWLVHEPWFEVAGWQTREQWQTSGVSTPTPW